MIRIWVDRDKNGDCNWITIDCQCLPITSSDWTVIDYPASARPGAKWKSTSVLERFSTPRFRVMCRLKASELCGSWGLPAWGLCCFAGEARGGAGLLDIVCVVRWSLSLIREEGESIECSMGVNGCECMWRCVIAARATLVESFQWRGKLSVTYKRI